MQIIQSRALHPGQGPVSKWFLTPLERFPLPARCSTNFRALRELGLSNFTAIMGGEKTLKTGQRTPENETG